MTLVSALYDQSLGDTGKYPISIMNITFSASNQSHCQILDIKNMYFTKEKRDITIPRVTLMVPASCCEPDCTVENHYVFIYISSLYMGLVLLG